MQQKGQGALEYLLLIGGAVLIAVIVIAVVTGMANNQKPDFQVREASCQQVNNQTACGNAEVDTGHATTDCVWADDSVVGTPDCHAAAN